MCGIIGYLGKRDINNVILVGLERLEYRGYDSCGMAVVNDGGIDIRKVADRLTKLKNIVEENPLQGEVGIGHTRWATHGKVSEENTHPFLDCKKEIALVHNGIIENYQEVKENLKNKGHKFKSDTDTEVIVHLIEDYYKEGISLEQAVIKSLKEIKGSYAVAVISKREPRKIVGARRGSPLIVGIGDKEFLIASDISALPGIARKMVVLEDGEVCVCKEDGIKFFDIEGKSIKKKSLPLDMDVSSLSKGRYRHFMLKEIVEQPEVIRRNLEVRIKNGRINLGSQLRFKKEELKEYSKIVIQACGTSYHAGLVGRYLIEKYGEIPVEVDIASEFSLRAHMYDSKSLMIAISQSGETADTLNAIRKAKERGMKIIAILNSKRSSMDRESDGSIYINAGPEIGVASTKAYTAQILNLLFLGVYIGKVKGILQRQKWEKLKYELSEIPEKMEKVLNKRRHIKKISEKYHNVKDFIFLGRGINYPSALEGALKLKEISYIHAAGYAAGEMKHGPISLVHDGMPVVAIVLKDDVYEKMVGNIQEVKSRGAKVIAIATEGDRMIRKMVDDVIYIPETQWYLSPLLVAVPLQLLAYYIAVKRGCDVDKPRNLAKSVTVE